MHPIVDFYFFELAAYSVWVMLGAVCGMSAAYLYLRWQSRRAAALSTFLDGAVIVFVAGAMGARAYHAAMRWDYYAQRPDEIAQFDLGGLAMRGALLAGLLALIAYARGRRLPLGKILDATAIGLCVGQTLGWVGALLHGANFGAVSDSPFALDLPDLYGLIEPRFPLQHAEIILFAGLFVVLVILALRQAQPGTLLVVYALIASLGNFALGFFRGDETLLVGTWRIDQVFDAVCAALVIALLFYQQLRNVGKVGIS